MSNLNDQAIEQNTKYRSRPSFTYITKDEKDWHGKVYKSNSSLARGFVMGVPVEKEPRVGTAFFTLPPESAEYISRHREAGMIRDDLNVMQVVAISDHPMTTKNMNLKVGDYYTAVRAVHDDVFFGEDFDIYANDKFIGHGFMYHHIDSLQKVDNYKGRAKGFNAIKQKEIQAYLAERYGKTLNANLVTNGEKPKLIKSAKPALIK